MILSLLALVALQQPDENRHYTVEHFPSPAGAVFEVGGMDFLPGGELVISTRRGQVWILENPLAEDVADARFRLFAEGLWEGLGLRVVDGNIFVMQRQELSLLQDTDEDGTCDEIRTVADDWGMSGNYHEFAYGLPVDGDGNFFASLNVGFYSPKWWLGKSPVPYRGWVIRIAPDGSVTPWASGFRSPCGLGLNAAGELFATDNQGDWMAVSPLFHVQKDGFYGHPASLDWTAEYRATQTLASDIIPPARAATDRRPAAVWFPYKWSRSPGNLVPDTTGGRFGPFDQQLIVAELTNGMLLRVQLEKVRGEYQGMAIPFRRQVGSSVRVRFGPDGSLFCGLTNRGWGGMAPADGIARVRFTGETPLEVHAVRLLQQGFEVDFTLPLAGEVTPAQVSLLQYDYDYWWEYGSPERGHAPREVVATHLSDDRRTLTIELAELVPAMMARVVLNGVTAENGLPLLHQEFAYTINQLPEGPLTDEHVVKIVPPPAARESQDEGWLRMTYGDATDRWTFTGWELCDAELDRDDPTRLKTSPGVNALTNTAAEDPSDYVSKTEFGDAEVHVEFNLPEKGRSAVWLMGRYGILLADGEVGFPPTARSTGTLLPGPGAKDLLPAASAYQGPGQQHALDAIYRAPRFDVHGAKLANARLEKLSLDDVLLYENLELPSPSLGAPLQEEAALGPVVLQGTRTHVSFGNIRVKPLWDVAETPGAGHGWTALLVDDDLSDWKISDDGIWEVDDGVIIGEGPRSHLFSPRGDYKDFEVRARVKISDGGNSGLYFRVAHGPGWPEGYEAQINSSFADPQKTGSLYNLAPVTTHLVPPDTWFDYHVLCRDEAEGTRIVIRINGAVITDHLDTGRKHAQGHIAIQQHHEGSVIEIENLELREL